MDSPETGDRRPASLQLDDIPRAERSPRAPESVSGIFLLFLAILACGVPSGSARAAGSLDELLDRTVKADGGEAALRKAAAVRETGKVTSLMRGGTAGILPL